MLVTSRSWMLDTIEFHKEFQSLLHGSGELVAIRDRALRIWDNPDPAARSYLELLSVAGPEEWSRSCEDAYLVDWYRVLMVPHLIPTRSLHSVDGVRRGLPLLGWHATEARRLARGRELLTLAERHLETGAIERLLVHFGWGHKGWLDFDDASMALDRMRRLDPRLFRSHPELVPVVENMFEVLEAASNKPDHVLLCISD